MLNKKDFENYCGKIRMFPEAVSEMKELFAFEKINEVPHVIPMHTAVPDGLTAWAYFCFYTEAGIKRIV